MATVSPTIKIKGKNRKLVSWTGVNTDTFNPISSLNGSMVNMSVTSVSGTSKLYGTLDNVNWSEIIEVAEGTVKSFRTHAISYKIVPVSSGNIDVSFMYELVSLKRKEIRKGLMSGVSPLAIYSISGNSPSLIADFGSGTYGVNGVSRTLSDIMSGFSRASTGSYVDSSGVLSYASSGAPRISHNKNSGSVLGFLSEGQHENIIPDSEDFTLWSTSNGTLSTTTMIYSGSSTAYEFTAAGGNARVYRNVTMTGGTWSVRCHFKTGGTTGTNKIYIIASGFTNVEAVYLDTSTGSLTPSGALIVNWVANDLGNGEWELIGEGGDTGVDEVGNLSFYARSAAGGNSTSGDGFKMFGAEVVLSDKIGSYVPTSGAAATRLADNASKPTSEFTFSSTSGSMLSEFNSVAVANQVLWSLNDTTLNERIYLSRDVSNQITLNVVDGGVTQASIVGATSSGTGPFKVAAAWSNGDFSISVNGAAVVTDAVGTLPTLTSLQYMSDYAVSNSGEGTVKQQIYYPVRLSDADLVTWSGS